MVLDFLYFWGTCNDAPQLVAVSKTTARIPDRCSGYSRSMKKWENWPQQLDTPEPACYNTPRKAGSTKVNHILLDRAYLPIMKMNDGTEVTQETWCVRRKEMLELLKEYSYGRTPDVDVTVSGVLKKHGTYICAGKCTEEMIELSYTTPYGKGNFPVQIFTPTKIKNPPVMLHIAFGLAPNEFIPVEEIMDGGYALVVVDYRDMVNDNHFGDYSDGIAAHFHTTQVRAGDEWGKIGMWAWGASRVLDYLIAERHDLDTKRVAVIGHSRLGKTALWCGAQDERFAAVISNNSGYGGAASSKHGKGERITDFVKCGSWDWFCENFKQYTDKLEDEKPYDQSFLLALIAPRLLLVGSAESDRGADPESEFLTTLHASQAWDLLGEKGLIAGEELPKPGAFLGEGNVLYHCRTGKHYLSREDWAAYIKFLNAKFK